MALNLTSDHLTNRTLKMILDENMEMPGKLTIELNGEVVQEIPNLVTTAG